MATYGNIQGVAAPSPSGIPGFNLAHVTAHAGGGATGATQLTAFVNVIDTVAATNDSVMLPPGYPSEPCVVINNGAQTATVFGYTSDKVTDTIAAATTTTQVTTGITIASGAIQVFLCIQGQTEVGNVITAAKWKVLKG